MLHASRRTGCLPVSCLRQMIRFQLNEKLYAIVGGGNQAELVFNLIEWVETEGRLSDLINGTVTANPGNLKL